MESGVILGESWGYALAFVWGAAIAVFIRRTEAGATLATHLMWLIVATGAGVDLLIIRLFFTNAAGLTEWGSVVSVFFVSSIVIAAWSVIELSGYLKGLVNGIRGEQD